MLKLYKFIYFISVIDLSPVAKTEWSITLLKWESDRILNFSQPVVILYIWVSMYVYMFHLSC